MSRYVMGLVTCGSRAEARKLAGLVLRRKLAACVNILGGVESRFWWKGKLDRAKEVMLFIKTTDAHVDAVTKAIRLAHSYDTPEIIFISIQSGERNYLRWISESLQ
jgi:periplasmic divalent cation tolerance protein